MKRPSGQLSPRQALMFALLLAAASMVILLVWVNVLTALLTFASLIGYAVIYTVFLKRATPQNIVIGGIAGAAPPALGWAAITGTLDPHALLLVLIIFVWTPPHFWAWRSSAVRTTARRWCRCYRSPTGSSTPAGKSCSTPCCWWW